MRKRPLPLSKAALLSCSKAHSAAATCLPWQFRAPVVVSYYHIIPYHQQQKRCPRMNSILDFLSIIGGYLPNHCVYDLCLSRSFLLFFGANQVLGYLPHLWSWVKKVRPFKNHLQITRDHRINQNPSEHRHKAFGSNQGGLKPCTKTQRSEDHFFKKMSIKISWSVSAPSCATTYIVKEPCFRRYCTPFNSETNKQTKNGFPTTNFGPLLGNH